MLKHGILGILNYGDMTGYEIRTVFKVSLNHFWQAQTSQIYRELQVLEKNGWITSSHVEQKGKPDKNVLSITKEGKKELLRWLKDEDEPGAIRNYMLMKTFFRGECSIAENIEYFKNLPEKETAFPDCQSVATQATGDYRKMIDDPLKALYWKFTIDFGIMYEKMLKEWCDNCVRELEALADKERV
ncbi:MAG: PadR family transcriptional regulator [Lachnospiraceae bacterium]|nr:PadR family transcriptional regulator [Lachnospiraceae bacterium]